MKRIMTHKLTVCVLVLIAGLVALALAGDITVKPNYLHVDGWATVTDNLYTNSDVHVDDRLYVDLYLHAYSHLYAHDDASVEYDLEIGDDLDVNGDIGYYSSPRCYVDDIFGDIAWFNTVICDDLTYSGSDPAYVLFDEETRDEIATMVQERVAPEKQAGAAVFFNKEAKRLEIYVASEGKFYDLAGNVVHSLPALKPPTAEYRAAYYLDSWTGQLLTRQVPGHDKYVLRNGYALDRETGELLKQTTGEVVTREEAVEVYSHKDDAYYDLEGNLLRQEQTDETVEYVTVHDLDSRTGQVIARRRPVRDKYLVKDGFVLDEETGEFENVKTGKVVPKQEAVELIKAADIVAQMTQQ